MVGTTEECARQLDAEAGERWFPYARGNGHPMPRPFRAVRAAPQRGDGDVGGERVVRPISGRFAVWPRWWRTMWWGASFHQ